MQNPELLYAQVLEAIRKDKQAKRGPRVVTSRRPSWLQLPGLTRQQDSQLLLMPDGAASIEVGGC